MRPIATYVAWSSLLRVRLFVCLSVADNYEPSKNGSTNRDAVRDVDSGYMPKDGGPRPFHGKGKFWGISQPIVNLGNIRREPEFSLGVSSDAACAVSILQQLVNIDRST